MVFPELLVNYLLMSTLHWLKVFGQDKNDTNPTISPRVVGGVVVKIEDVGGFIVTLRYSGRFRCGGSLIYDRIVLTAAHCFFRRPNTDLWTVVGGISTLGEMGLQRGVRAYRLPAGYSRRTFDMDVAVVLLKDPMEQSWKLRTPDLCRQPLRAGTSVTILGFGTAREEYKSPGFYLRQAIVPIVDHDYCVRVYSPSRRITRNMLCAGAMGKRDSCAYDSGGPLIFGNQICGIVSFARGCAHPGYPGVNVNVYNVKPFISRTVKALMWQR